MKTILNIIAAGFFLIAVNSCTTQTNIAPAKVTSLLQGSEFTFMAQRANPTNYDVINVMNSLPTSSASQMLNLDYGYIMEIKKNQVKLVLPYFGRMFNPGYDTTKNSFRVTSKDFSIDEKSGKRGSFVYTILPKDQQNIRKIILEVYKNGKSYLSIDANDRQPISYDGYITENSMIKEEVKN